MENETHTQESMETPEMNMSGSSEQGMGSNMDMPKGKSIFKSIWLWIIIVLIAAAAALYFTGAADTLKNDLTGWQAVAMVNGEKITRGDLDQRVNQVEASFKQQGQELTGDQLTQVQQQMLNALIDERLVLQEASNAGISITDDQVNDTYKNEVVTQFPDEDALKTQLTALGLTEKTLKENIANQLAIQEYVSQNIGQDKLAVSEDDAMQLYDQAKESASSTDNIPAFEDVKTQIIDQIKQQRTGQYIQDLVKQLRDKATIETYL